MQHINRLAVFIAATFVAGFLLGHFDGHFVFGYASIEECRAKEAKGAMTQGAVFAANAYCRTLFPTPVVDVQEFATDAATDPTAGATGVTPVFVTPPRFVQ